MFAVEEANRGNRRDALAIIALRTEIRATSL